MKIMYYILDENAVVPAESVQKWAQWFEKSDRRVALTEFGPYRISTVFLGFDHNFMESGPPVLWETMVFGKGPLSEKMDRCSGTREQAEAMHQSVVDWVMANHKTKRKTTTENKRTKNAAKNKNTLRRGV